MNPVTKNWKKNILKNGDETFILGDVKVEAVPAYWNTTAGREMYHPRHRDNGYVFTFDGLRIYVAEIRKTFPNSKN